MFTAIGAYFAGAWIKLVAIGLAVALIFGAGVAVRGYYAAQAMAAHVKLDDEAQQKRLRDTAKIDADTAAREAKAAHENSDQRAAYTALAAAAAASDAHRLDALRSGTTRVRIAIVPGSCGPAALPPGSTASGADGETTAQLDPAVAERVERITDTGDESIRQLSALQDWVDRNVRNVNAGQRPAEVTP